MQKKHKKTRFTNEIRLCRCLVDNDVNCNLSKDVFAVIKRNVKKSILLQQKLIKFKFWLKKVCRKVEKMKKITNDDENQNLMTKNVVDDVNRCCWRQISRVNWYRLTVNKCRLLSVEESWRSKNSRSKNESWCWCWCFF